MPVSNSFCAWQCWWLQCLSLRLFSWFLFCSALCAGLRRGSRLFGLNAGCEIVPQPIGPEDGNGDNYEKICQVCPLTAVQGLSPLVSSWTFVDGFMTSLGMAPCEYFVLPVRQRRNL